MIDWILLSYARMFGWAGRATRREYLATSIFNLVVCVAAIWGFFILADLAGPGRPQVTGLVILQGFLAMASVGAAAICQLSLTVRRLKDQNFGAIGLLWLLVPFLGFGILVAVMGKSGMRGENRFGEDPRLLGSAAEVRELYRQAAAAQKAERDAAYY